MSSDILVCTLISQMNVAPIPSYIDKCASCKNDIWVSESTKELGKLVKICSVCFLKSGLGSMGEVVMSEQQREEIKELIKISDKELDRLMSEYSKRMRQATGYSDN